MLSIAEKVLDLYQRMHTISVLAAEVSSMFPAWSAEADRLEGEGALLAKVRAELSEAQAALVAAVKERARVEAVIADAKSKLG